MGCGPSSSGASRPVKTHKSTGPKPLGLHISAIRKFIADHPQAKSDHLTTSQINSAFVKPETKASHCSYLQLYTGDCDDVTGQPLTAPATVFVSHAWKYVFYDVVVDVLEQYAKRHPNAYFWFDLFTNNQNEIANKDFDWFSSTFRNSVTSIGEVLLVLSPWNNPIPIQRAWCLFEIYNALEESDVSFSVNLPNNDIKELGSAVLDDPDCVSEALSDIQAEKAEAKSDSDRELIFQVIRESHGGFSHVNKQVKDGLRKWYVDQVKSLADNGEEDYALIGHCASVMKQFGYLNDALQYYTKSLQIELKTLSENHIEVATTYNNIGNVYNRQSKHEEALEYYQKSLSIKLNLQGENSEEVALAYNNIANVYSDQGRTEEALDYYRKSLTIRQKILGENHPEVAASYNNIAILLEDDGESDEALEYYNKSLTIKLNILGENHLDVSDTYNNMAILYLNNEDPDKAIEYFNKSLAIALDIIGENNPDVASTYNNIGVVYRNKGELDKALSTHTKALEIKLAILGENHTSTADSLLNIGLVYEDKGVYTKAHDYLQRCLKIWRTSFGEEHHKVISTLKIIHRIESR